jgi:hypothetical protein
MAILKNSMLEQVRSSANRSLAVLENAFIRHGSGRHFSLVPDPMTSRNGLTKSVARRPVVKTRKIAR